MEKNKEWHGVDASLEECFYEYGFVMRYNEKYDEYQVCYQVIDRWFLGSFDFEEWINDLKSSEEGEYPDLHGLSKMVGMEPEEYLEQIDPVNLLCDLLHYYCFGDVFGVDYSKGMTDEEAWEFVTKGE